MPSSKECFMAQSPSSLEGKYLKSGEEQFDRILRLANENTPADPRVSDTSPSENMLSLPIFPGSD